eukprot:gene6688-9172_t
MSYNSNNRNYNIDRSFTSTEGLDNTKVSSSQSGSFNNYTLGGGSREVKHQQIGELKLCFLLSDEILESIEAVLLEVTFVGDYSSSLIKKDNYRLSKDQLISNRVYFENIALYRNRFQYSLAFEKIVEAGFFSNFSSRTTIEKFVAHNNPINIEGLTNRNKKKSVIFHIYNLPSKCGLSVKQQIFDYLSCLSTTEEDFGSDVEDFIWSAENQKRIVFENENQINAESPWWYDIVQNLHLIHREKPSNASIAAMTFIGIASKLVRNENVLPGINFPSYELLLSLVEEDDLLKLKSNTSKEYFYVGVKKITTHNYVYGSDINWLLKLSANEFVNTIVDAVNESPKKLKSTSVENNFLFNSSVSNLSPSLIRKVFYSLYESTPGIGDEQKQHRKLLLLNLLNSITWTRPDFHKYFSTFVSKLSFTELIDLVELFATINVGSDGFLSQSLVRISIDIFQNIILKNVPFLSVQDVALISAEIVCYLEISSSHIKLLFDEMIKSGEKIKIEFSLEKILNTHLVAAVSPDDRYFLLKSCIDWILIWSKYIKETEPNLDSIYNILFRVLEGLKNASQFVDFDLTEFTGKLLNESGRALVESFNPVKALKSIRLLYLLFRKKRSHSNLTDISSAIESHALNYLRTVLGNFLDTPQSFEQAFDLLSRDNFDEEITKFEKDCVLLLLNILNTKIGYPKLSYEKMGNLSVFFYLFMQSMDRELFLLEHDGMTSILKYIQKLMELIKEKKFTLAGVDEVTSALITPSWLEALDNICKCSNVKLTRTDFTEIKDAVSKFRQELIGLRNYVTRCVDCLQGHCSITHLKLYLDFISSLESKTSTLTLAEVSNPMVWELLSDLKPHAQFLTQVQDSTLITTLWEQIFRSLHPIIDEDQSSLVDNNGLNFIELSEGAVSKVRQQLKIFFEKIATPDLITLSEVRKIWVDGLIWDQELKVFQEIFPVYSVTLERSYQMIQHLTKVALFQSVYAPGLISALEIFDCSLDSDLGRSSERLVSVGDDISLFEFNDSIINWQYCMGDDWESLITIVVELGKAKELVDFVKVILEEKNFNLIDMVEEHSDSIIRAETVSEFDVVRRFLRPLLTNPLEVNAERWIARLKVHIRDHAFTIGGIHLLPGKINSCRLHANGLRDMFTSVANREASTKNLVSQILKNGVVSFSRLLEGSKVEVEMNGVRQRGKIHKCLEDEMFDVSLLGGTTHVLLASEKIRVDYSKYSLSVTSQNKDKGFETRDESSLDELRSRALLLVNSASKIVSVDISVEEQALERENLQKFIEVAEALGHFSYRERFLRFKFNLESVNEQLLRIQADQLAWEDSLKKLRRSSYFLNFFFSKQLWYLDAFFSNLDDFPNCEKKALALLHFANDSISSEDYKRYRGAYANTFEIDPYERLNLLASTLNHCLDGVKELKVNTSCEPDNRIFMSTYETDGDLIPLLFSVFPGGEFKRHQILICDEETIMEEINMFLQRVFSSNNEQQVKMFAILHLHKLTHNDLSSLLRLLSSSAREKHPKNQNNCAILLRVDMRDCVSGMKIPVKQFSTCSKLKIAEIVQTKAKDVFHVTSLAAGVGKSEFCRNHAHNQYRKKLVMVLISDHASRYELLESVQNESFYPHECLYLDVTSISNQAEIAWGLFELLYLNVAQKDTAVVHFNTGDVCFVEESNILSSNTNNINALQYFKNIEKSWQIKDLIVSSKLTSNVQVVCHYLKMVEENSLATKEAVFHYDPVVSDKQVNVVSLSSAECQRLLKKFFFDFFTNNPPSLNVFFVFLNVLANQLKEFSVSYHFSIQALKWSGSDAKNRDALVRNLISSSRDFATRSVLHVRNRQYANLMESGNEDNLGLIKWEDNNQLMFAVSKGLSVLFRNLNDVPVDIKSWYDTQSKGRPLKNYFELNTNDLREQMSNFCGRTDIFADRADYVLTADNFLKGVMMLLREKAYVPVIIMGEAECGKTSLIRFIAGVAGAHLEVLNVHAGLSKADIGDKIIEFIVTYINSMNNINREEENLNEETRTAGSDYRLWIFLDEINTCDELGFINSIICHRELPGFPIPSYVSFFAACNPYTKVKKGQIMDVIGLSSPKRVGGSTTDLVYRVNPLPDTMFDFIWDFGSLAPEDEKRYIFSMIEKIKSQLPDKSVLVLTDLISASQTFIRNKFGRSSVSVRDVRRVKILVQWFIKSRNGRPVFVKKSYSRYYGGFYRDTRNVEEDGGWVAMILALAHCYRCRLSNTELRHEYDDCLSGIFHVYDKADFTGNWIREEIRREQVDYVRRMNLGEGIALNNSLLENIFVLMVCILTKMPVFLVGKPGSSKSLSISLIASNLRGPDSEDDFFKQFPEVKMISYLSLSFFDFCRNFGLAEISPFNPLKVLHSRLETVDDSPLPVAVVGISNWTLDASKMSRAIQLSRSEPTVNDLYQTALRIVESIYLKDNKSQLPQRICNILEKLSEAYSFFYAKELRSRNNSNFHGLRDFYCLCKHIGRKLRDRALTDREIVYAIRRNFGGLNEKESLMRSDFRAFFSNESTELHTFGDNSQFSVVDLLLQNLRDPDSRHLMLITQGDSFLNIMQDLFQDAGIFESRVIIGSKLKSDLSENYRYRILSEIILSMERGESLALKNLDGIYESLYDMLNQNYTVVAEKKNCRIALGAFSNPMAHVHDRFKCVVVVEASKIKNLDPPFLNRFEKQLIDFTSILSPMQLAILLKLQAWVERISHLAHSMSNDVFSDRDIFSGVCDGTLSSLIFVVCQTLAHENIKEEEEAILDRCKMKLFRISSCQGVVRALVSNEGVLSPVETNKLCSSYFQDLSHINLKHFIGTKVNQPDIISKSLLTTYTNFYHFDFTESIHYPDTLNHVTDVVGAKLSSFDSDAALSGFIHSFIESESKLCLLQCEFEFDKENLLLAKVIIDREMKIYQLLIEQDIKKEKDFICKSAIILVHNKTELYEEDRVDAFSTYFSQGWDQFHIDSLEQDEQSWFKLYHLIEAKSDLLTFIESNDGFLNQVMKDELITAFRSFKFNKSPFKADEIKEICAKITAHHELMELLKQKVTDDIKNNYKELDWAVKLACKREELEFSSLSLVSAVEEYARGVIRQSFVKSIYLLVKYSALDSYLLVETSPLPQYFVDIFLKCPSLSLSNIIAPRGSECYNIDQIYYGLKFPFSNLFCELIEEEKQNYMSMKASGKSLAGYETIIKNKLLDIFEPCGIFSLDEIRVSGLYTLDVCLQFAMENCPNSSINFAMRAIPAIIRIILPSGGGGGGDNDNITIIDPSSLHLTLWENEVLITNVINLMKIAPNQLLELDSEASNLQSFASQLVVQFCRSQWLPNPPLLSPSHHPFDVQNLDAWCSRVESKITSLDLLCQSVGLDYYEVEDAVEENVTYLLDLLPYARGIGVMIDFCNLLRRINLGNEPHEIPVFLEDFDRYFAMGGEFLEDILSYLDRAAFIFPAHKKEIELFVYSICEKWLLIAIVRTRGEEKTNNNRLLLDMHLMHSDIYKVFAKRICSEQINPPLSSNRLIDCFMCGLHGAVSDILWDNSKGDDRIGLPSYQFSAWIEEYDEGSVSKAIIIQFENLFENASNSMLEVLMVDWIHATYLSETDVDLIDELSMELACESFVGIFNKLKMNEKMRFVDRLYALCFLRIFLNWATLQIVSEGNIEPILSETLEQTLGRHILNDDSGTAHVLGIYILKATRFPYSELKMKCETGGAIFNKARWFELFPWDKNDIILLLNINPFIHMPHFKQLDDAWDRVFYQIHSYSELEDAFTLFNDSNVILRNLVKVAFMNCCLSPNSAKSEIEYERIKTFVQNQLQLQLNNKEQTRLFDLLQLSVSQFMRPTIVRLPYDNLTVDVVCLLSFCVAIACSNEISFRNGPFGIYCRSPLEWKNSFVLAAQSNELSTILGALNSPQAKVTSYRCGCGYIYVIGECGKPMSSAPCRQCGRVLGGEEHVFADNTQVPMNEMQEDEKGYFFPHEFSFNRNHSERKLTPDEYRILSLFVHCSVLVSVLTSSNEEVMESFHSSQQETIQMLWDRIIQDWDTLNNRLVEGRKEILCGLLHCIIHEIELLSNEMPLTRLPNTPEERKLAEDNFSIIVRELLKEPTLHGTDACNRMMEGDKISLLEREVTEIDILNVNMPYYQIARCIRIVSQPTFESFSDTYFSDGNNLTRYPVIGAFFKHEANLARIADMWPLIKWTNSIRKMLNFKLSQLDVGKSVDSILNEYKDIPSFETFPDEFKKFSTAWNHFFEFTRTIEFNQEIIPDCNVLSKIDSGMNPATSIIFSCVRTEHEGRYVPYMLHVLGELQNKFLFDVLRLSQFEIKGASSRLIQSSSETDIINYNQKEIWKSINRFCRSKLAYGSGREFEFDFSQIEGEIVKLLVRDKPLFITDILKPGNFEIFQFSHEIFQDQRGLFERINRLVPQEPIADINLIRSDKCISREEDVMKKIMPAIEAILYILQQLKPSRGLGERTLMEFVIDYLDEGTVRLFEFYCKPPRNSIIGKVMIKQIEALYEVLEDTISDTVLGCLDRKYSAPISEDVRRRILKSAQFIGGEKQLESCIRRFILCYLRGANALDASHDFSLYFDYVRWPKHVDMENPESGKYDVYGAIFVNQCETVHRYLCNVIAEKEKEAARLNFDHGHDDNKGGVTDETGGGVKGGTGDGEGGNGNDKKNAKIRVRPEGRKHIHSRS